MADYIVTQFVLLEPFLAYYPEYQFFILHLKGQTATVVVRVRKVANRNALTVIK